MDQNVLEPIYDEKIAPLMTEIIAICMEHKLPMFATFQIGEKDFCTTSLPQPGCSNVVELCRRLVTTGMTAFAIVKA